METYAGPDEPERKYILCIDTICTCMYLHQSTHLGHSHNTILCDCNPVKVEKMAQNIQIMNKIS